MFKKYIAIFMVLLMVFMAIPAVATTATEEPMARALVPVTVMGVGYTWNSGSFVGTSMLNNSYPDAVPGNEYIILNDLFAVDGLDYTTGDPTGDHYAVTYTYVNLRTFDYIGIHSVPSAVVRTVEGFNGDLLIVDMFFSTIMNSREPAFYLATVTSDAERKVSIFSENSTTHLSAAPPGFDVRDTVAQSHPGNFTDAFFVGLEESGATAFVATWDDFIEILSYSLPEV